MRKREILLILLLLVGVSYLLIQYSQPADLPTIKQPLPSQVLPTSQIVNEASPSAQSQSVLGVRTKVSNCLINQGYPDHECTPGAVFPTVSKEDICTSGYSKKVRAVSQKTKDEVYREYNILVHDKEEYEVDHLIPLELGGSNEIANLWPEPAEPQPGFHQKDKVENFLHNEVCKGNLSLQEAQFKISTDWYSVYQAIP